MRHHPTIPRTAIGFNMTPMIDVVFLLIIFFLVSSHLANRERRLELPLPAAATGLDDPQQQQPRVTLNVLGDGTVLLAGRPVDADQLTGQLQQLRAEHGDQLEIRIRADRAVPYKHVSPLLIAAARTKIWNVTFAVVSPQERL